MVVSALSDDSLQNVGGFGKNYIPRMNSWDVCNRFWSYLLVTRPRKATQQEAEIGCYQTVIIYSYIMPWQRSVGEGFKQQEVPGTHIQTSFYTYLHFIHIQGNICLFSLSLSLVFLLSPKSPSGKTKSHRIHGSVYKAGHPRSSQPSPVLQLFSMQGFIRTSSGSKLVDNWI